jgi:Domain of unknown function (DUF1772)
MGFELVALVCTALFAGACAYVSFVEQPARMACGPAVALAQWRPSFKRAAAMQAGLAAVGLLSAVAAYTLGRGLPVLVGGLLLGAMAPYTLVVIMPTNRQLLDGARGPETAGTMELLHRWGQLHAVRTAASLVALGVLAADALGYL